MFGLFRGHPGLVIRTLPGALIAVALKALFEAIHWQPLQFSPLLTGVIAAEVFIIGFLLSGTTTDFKEAEHLPGDIAASLETMADEFLIASPDLQLPEARAGLVQLVAIARAIRSWVAANHGIPDEVLFSIRGLNGTIHSIEPKAQAGAATRLKGEQAAVRAHVLRIETLRGTSFVSSAYLIGEVTGTLLVVVLLLTNIGANVPTLVVVGLISFLLFYLFVLIRDLDNPFKYPNGKAGPADVPVDILDRVEARLQALLASHSVAGPPVAVPAPEAAPSAAAVAGPKKPARAKAASKPTEPRATPASKPKEPASAPARRRAAKKVAQVEPAES